MRYELANPRQVVETLLQEYCRNGHSCENKNPLIILINTIIAVYPEETKGLANSNLFCKPAYRAPENRQTILDLITETGRTMPNASFFDCAILISARCCLSSVGKYGLPLTIRAFDIHFTSHIVNNPSDTQFRASRGFVTAAAQQLFKEAKTRIHPEPEVSTQLSAMRR